MPTCVRAKRRHDAAGHGLPNAERIADRKHDVADFEAVGIGELDRSELDTLGLQLQHGKIGLLVLQDQLRRKLAPIRQRHSDLCLAASRDHMIVGDDDALFAHQHAGAERVLHALARDAEILAEQPAEKRIVGEGRNNLRDLAAHIDVHHGGRHAFDHRRERLLHLDHALGHDALRVFRRERTQEEQRSRSRPQAPLMPSLSSRFAKALTRFAPYRQTMN